MKNTEPAESAIFGYHNSEEIKTSTNYELIILTNVIDCLGSMWCQNPGQS